MATALPSDRPNGPAPQVLPSVLVVEDNPDDFYFLQRAFRQAGVCATLHRVQDGHQAQTYLQRALEIGQLPVCIVADLMMPVLNGFELIEFVKGNPALQAVPVVVLSTSANERDITRAYQLGANSYIVKPSNFAALVTISQAVRDQWLPRAV